MLYQKCPKCGAFAYARSFFNNGYYCFPKQGGCGKNFPVKIKNINGLFCHIIPPRKDFQTKKDFLTKEITAYFHDYYIPDKYGGGEFSRMILAIKNNGTDIIKHNIAKIIRNDLDKILELNKVYLEDQPIVVAVPRSKPDNFWKKNELQFRPAISMGLKKSAYIVKREDSKWMIDGTHYLTRILETKTTHLAHLDKPENTGPEPYPGITRDTCRLDGSVSGKNIILIDDIYTECKYIDEDCIQFLLDNSARRVILYTLGMTKRQEKDISMDVPF